MVSSRRFRRSAYVFVEAPASEVYVLTFYQYGLSAVTIMAQVGSIYLNFALWALSLVPAWYVIREIGVSLGDKKVQRGIQGLQTPLSESDDGAAKT